MFRHHKLDVPERATVQKSRSMETLPSKEEGRKKDLRSTTSVDTVLSEWQELTMLKIAAPCITCLLPHLSEDLVCSALLAVGATPLMTEDPGDIDRDIENAKAIVVDVSAPTALVEAFVGTYRSGTAPLVLVVTGAGTSDRKRDLAVRVIEECEPSAVVGRRGDVYALSQAILEKIEEDVDKAESSTTSADVAVNLPLPPAVEPLLLTPRRYHKASSTLTHSSGSGTSGAVAKKMAQHEQQGKAFKRLPSVNPLLRMKGQFRESCMGNVSVQSSLRFAQLLAAHINCFVHLYEVNTITSGEMVAEVNKEDPHLDYIHSQVPCCGAMLAAALSCVTGPVITIKHCACGLALHYVSSQEAVSSFKTKDHPPPGTLKQVFLDKLYQLDDVCLQKRAKIVTYSVGVTPS